eukprot:CAMPEP_0171296168 /NCGR_PEP_ID=MMETSP0816-20121228/4857_1 /TAXON_ID=420281 /ORGANISM="Proboscia inermis, Strain CCAP1064/1" /LENGTH=258 /DNA_ID=CAMNT_0011769431 /DNA_START=96 /DNA_END=872 /DNA_ORIENTATION=-
MTVRFLTICYYVVLGTLLRIHPTLSFSTPNTPKPSPIAIDRKFVQVVPLKAAMLTKNWQGHMLDVEEKVGVVPELGATSVSTRLSRTGPELPRRQLCKAQYASFYECTFALALADKESSPNVRIMKRKVITLLNVDGKLVGPSTVTFASLTQPATMALVVQLQDPPQWSVLALLVNPTERNLEAIVASECAMLEELRRRAVDAGVSLRLKDTAKESLAGTCEQLSLVPMEEESADGDGDGDGVDENEGAEAVTAWFQC